MPDYEAMSKELPAMKGRLTRLQNREGSEAKYEAIITECHKTLQRFEEIGFPDCWARWEVALGDSRIARDYYIREASHGPSGRLPDEDWLAARYRILKAAGKVKPRENYSRGGQS